MSIRRCHGQAVGELVNVHEQKITSSHVIGTSKHPEHMSKEGMHVGQSGSKDVQEVLLLMSKGIDKKEYMKNQFFSVGIYESTCLQSSTSQSLSIPLMLSLSEQWSCISSSMRLPCCTLLLLTCSKSVAHIKALVEQ